MAIRHFLSDGSVCLSGFGKDSAGKTIGMVSSIIRADLGFATRAELDQFIERLDDHERAAIEGYKLVPMAIEVED